MQVQSLNIAWCLNVGLLRTRITTKGSHQHRAAISLDLGALCLSTDPALERTFTSSTPRTLSSCKNTTSLIANQYTCVLPDPCTFSASVKYIHQCICKTQYLTSSVAAVLLFHQLDIRKILHVQFHLPSICGHDAMSLGSAIYYWCGQKTPQPTW